MIQFDTYLFIHHATESLCHVLGDLHGSDNALKTAQYVLKPCTLMYAFTPKTLTDGPPEIAPLGLKRVQIITVGDSIGTP